jgi:hypothetical protein
MEGGDRAAVGKLVYTADDPVQDHGAIRVHHLPGLGGWTHARIAAPCQLMAQLHGGGCVVGFSYPRSRLRPRERRHYIRSIGARPNRHCVVEGLPPFAISNVGRARPCPEIGWPTFD